MLGQTPSAPPRCKALDDWDPLTSWLSPVIVTWPVRSSKHLCLFDSVITGAFLLTPCLLWLCHDLLFSHDTIVSLTLSPTWHDSVTWVIWLALSSQTPVSLYTCHLTGMTLSHVSHNTVTCVTYAQRRWQCSSSSTEFCHVCLCADCNKLVSELPFVNWSSRLLSIFYHLLLQYITCHTLHVTHSMSRIVCNTQHVAHWLLYIACQTLYVTKKSM